MEITRCNILVLQQFTMKLFGFLIIALLIAAGLKSIFARWPLTEASTRTIKGETKREIKRDMTREMTRETKRPITRPTTGVAPAHPSLQGPARVSPLSVEESSRLKSKATEARIFINSHHFNNRFAFFLDMSIASGQNRFFVYDLTSDTLLHVGLVTHGRCNEQWLEGRRYGNTVGCACTSLGKYRVGSRYSGRFGTAYKLHGLEATNDKAFERFVVLHAMSCVPHEPVNAEICQSDGCPSVAPEFVDLLVPVLDDSQKPVLLWIFDH